MSTNQIKGRRDTFEIPSSLCWTQCCGDLTVVMRCVGHSPQCCGDLTVVMRCVGHSPQCCGDLTVVLRCVGHSAVVT